MDEQQTRKIASQVRRARRVKDWTQEELANAAGVAPGTVNRIENDKPIRPGNLRAVLDALDIAPVTEGPRVIDDGVKLALDIVERWLAAVPDSRREFAVQELIRFTVLGDWEEPEST